MSADAESVVTFTIDGATCGVPLQYVERALPMPAVAMLPEAPSVILGVINLHGAVVPVLDLRRRLGLPHRPYGASAHLLVVRTARRRLAIAADQVVGVARLPHDSVAAVDSATSRAGAVTGAAALPGGLVLLHDVEAFVAAADEEQLGRALQEQP
jgi:purine-binding chemotaxis protein CheW